jgi:hypothetical protein
MPEIEKRCAMLSLLACSLAVGGCEIREQKLDEEALRSLDTLSKDPIATQVRNVRLASNDSSVICGEANLKDDEGNFRGFHVFMAKRPGDKPAHLAIPAAVRGVADETVIGRCALPEQRQQYQQQIAVAEAAFKAELDKFERETRVKELEAQLRLRQAQEQ